MIEPWGIFPHWKQMHWLVAAIAVVGSAMAADRVVINEIHFDPVDQHPAEFVELYNPTDTAVDVSGWELEKYRFPAGTVMSPRGFLVVAQNLEGFKKEFGQTALGPLAGKLSNDGEKLTLSNSRRQIVDQVKYGVGFPWPTATLGAGSSLERLHPDLDASQPASWRASGFPAVSVDSRNFVNAGSAWRWRKGDKEASEPRGSWREMTFVEDPSWQTGNAGFGYGDNDDATVIPDMQGRYNCIFLRQVFTVPATKPEALTLRIRVDDGCVVWLNGKEVMRRHLPAGEPTVEMLADDHEGTEWEELMLPNEAELLKPGGNVVAVQVFNSARDSSDLTFDLTLSTPGGKDAGKRPTPGALNGVFTSANPPQCRGVRHMPDAPKPREAVALTAEFSRSMGARGVTAKIQFIEPGAYVRKADPDYERRWIDVPMRDDGMGGDLRAGDQVWTTIVPPEQQVNRRLVRYRIVAEGAAGEVVRLPYADDTVPNFAYYVAAPPATWSGAMNPGKSPTVTFTPEAQSTLPALTLLAHPDDVSRSQWDGNYNHRKLPGTLVYRGKVYDHIEFKNRGSASTYVTGKNKWGFHFAKAHDLDMRDAWGRPYTKRWNSFALNACASPWVQINRGMAGLDEAISFRCYQLVGVPASDTVPLQLRVVTGTNEVGANQFEGDLWGLYTAVEDVDRALLENHRWPDGILVSPEKGMKRVPSGVEANKLWDEFRGGPKGDAEKWWRQHMNVQSYYSFHAINRFVGNVDIRPGANHFFYRHPETGWMPVPWDLDMQFIPRTHQPGFIDQTRCLEVPALALEYRNRAREILDLLGSDPSPNGGQIGQIVAEYARMVEPKPELSWAMLDACKWNQHPRSGVRGTFYQPDFKQDMFGGPFTRKLATPNFAGFCRYVIDYCTDSRPQKNYAPNDGNHLGYGWGYLKHEARDAEIPETPVIRYSGQPGFPRNGLVFAITPFADPQGPQTFGAVQWRLAPIGRNGPGPGACEIEPPLVGTESAVQTAGTQLSGSVCKAGVTYRVRARYKDSTGRWSHWSAPVEWMCR